ncbi:MAG: exodeoxyribonuclease III [Candidatus Nomurabacteria bacterium]|nr:MAG: exodeoxyribonuclease III [Candidatus Nomurabacteria bacterium]
MSKSLVLQSWNINGIRAAVRKGFTDYLKKEKPDVIGLQEIKISEEARLATEFDFGGYVEHWHSAKKPGYSGTAVLVKNGIAHTALPKLAWDDEGRIQAIDMGKYIFLNIYFPNASNDGLKRLAFKMQWNEKLLNYLKQLEKKKPLVITGDYNVAHEEIDLARPKENTQSPGFTPEERTWMTKFLKTGYVDTWREANPKKVQYTWWSQRGGARSRNVGWRIDYFCVSQKFLKQTTKPAILDQVMGSDHCPVSLIVSS